MSGMSMRSKTKMAVATVITVVLLSACQIHSDTVINADGTGTYTIEESGDKTMVAESMGVEVEDVVVSIEEFFESSLAESEDIPETYFYEVTEDEDNVYIAVTSSFSYDEEGWFFGEDTNSPQGSNVVLNSADNTATYTYDAIAASQNVFIGEDAGSSGTDWKVSVTFPGEVLEYSDGATVDGNTVTWNDEQVENAFVWNENMTATGSLSESSSNEILGVALLFFAVGTVGGVTGYLIYVFDKRAKQRRVNNA